MYWQLPRYVANLVKALLHNRLGIVIACCRQQLGTCFHEPRLGLRLSRQRHLNLGEVVAGKAIQDGECRRRKHRQNGLFHSGLPFGSCRLYRSSPDMKKAYPRLYLSRGTTKYPLAKYRIGYAKCLYTLCDTTYSASPFRLVVFLLKHNTQLRVSHDGKDRCLPTHLFGFWEKAILYHFSFFQNRWKSDWRFPNCRLRK